MRPTHWLTLIAVLSLAACGSDDDDDSNPTSDSDQIADALVDLSSRTETSLSSPEAQFLTLNGDIPFDLLDRFVPDDALLPLQIARKLDEPRELAELLKQAPQNFIAARVLARMRASKGMAYPPYGTYQYNPSSLDFNFPNWELVAADVPADGYVFEFDFTDGFTAIGPLGNEIAVAGEIRALNVVWNEYAEATDLVFEIAIRTPVQTLLTTIMRIPIQVDVDPKGITGSIQIGDAEANSPNITAFPDVCFLGSALFAFELDVAETAASIAWQAYESNEEFVIGFAANVQGDLPNDDVTAVGGSIYFGQTDNPAEPEWEFNLGLSTFAPTLLGPSEPIVYVDGQILYRGNLLATIAGETTEISVDINGDGTTDLDESCGDVDIVFSDDPENPTNICRWFYLHQDDFGALMAKWSTR